MLVDEGTRVEVSQERGPSLILPEARRFDRALTRAQRILLVSKQVRVVPIGSKKESIQSLADHLVANHPKLYGDP